MRPRADRIVSEVARRPHIAVVDDHPGVADLLAGLVERWTGYEAEAFTSRVAFLAALERRPRPDAIILDLRMPHPGVREILQRLSERRLLVPVIVLCASGEALTRDVITADVVGLQKPADPQALISLLKTAVEGTPRTQSAR